MSFLVCLEGHMAPTALENLARAAEKMETEAKIWCDGDFPLMCCLLTAESVTVSYRQIHPSSADCNGFEMDRARAAGDTHTDRHLWANEWDILIHPCLSHLCGQMQVWFLQNKEPLIRLEGWLFLIWISHMISDWSLCCCCYYEVILSLNSLMSPTKRYPACFKVCPH